jgi:Protein of unknown function (DUF2934)
MIGTRFSKPNLEEAIRERAYHLWVADGQPEGQADIYWHKAQREILTTSVESSDSNTRICSREIHQKGKGRPIEKKQTPRRIEASEHQRAGPATRKYKIGR